MYLKNGMYLPSTCEDIMMIDPLLLNFLKFEGKNFNADVYVRAVIAGLNAFLRLHIQIFY